MTIPTIWLDTDQQFIDTNGGTYPDAVEELMDEAGWCYNENLPKLLAPFVSDDFRLVVDGTDYEPIEVNEHGGKQSTIKGRFDLLPAFAIEDVAIVLQQGAIKYGERNWRTIPAKDHVNHALRHCFAWLTTKERGELTHAACRLLMAIEVIYDRE